MANTPMSASIITPTRNRGALLPQLVATFRAQTQPGCELLVADDTPEPSAFMAQLDDPQVSYFHLREAISTGRKRNLLRARARGGVIVHFDDDDFYHPTYVATMLAWLASADLVKLSAWFNYSRAHRTCLYWDTRLPMSDGVMLTPGQPPSRASFAVADEHQWGYGFSYAYRAAAARGIDFEDVDFGEDYLFCCRLREGGRATAVPDTAGLALHVVHDSNLSRTFGQYRVPLFVPPRLMGAGVLPYMAPAPPGAKMVQATTGRA